MQKTQIKSYIHAIRNIFLIHTNQFCLDLVYFNRSLEMIWFFHQFLCFAHNSIEQVGLMVDVNKNHNLSTNLCLNMILHQYGIHLIHKTQQNCIVYVIIVIFYYWQSSDNIFKPRCMANLRYSLFHHKSVLNEKYNNSSAFSLSVKN